MRSTREKQLVLLGLIIFGLIYSIIVFYTYVPAGGADNYAHFNISRWAFRYPQLFLDHWGKPVFTIVTAPLSQLGFEAVRVFNIVTGILTAWFCYLIAKKNQLKSAWVAPVTVIFTPMYFVMMSSGMTEVLFSLFLVTSILLFFKENYIWSAVLISIIFLVRTEGLTFLLLFLIGFLVKKQYRAIPFLITGFISFSFIGWIYHYHDFWWLITSRPYATGGSSVYGSGNWYHYLVKMPAYLGYIITTLSILGTIIILTNWVKSKFKIKPFIFIILILGSFWGYLIIHSYLWWKGETSAGLLRVMAGVSPIAALIGLFAVDFAQKKIKQGFLRMSIIIVLSLYLAFNSFSYFRRSTKGDVTAEILLRVTDWLIESGNLKHRLVVHNPYFAFSTGIDAWNNQIIQYGFSDNEHPENNLPDSTIFLWDAQFSANEGRLPLEKIIENPNFEVIAYFEPEIPFKVLGNNNYKIVAFRKLTGVDRNNRAIIRNLKQSEIDQGIYHIVEFDFEQSFTNKDQELRRLLSETDTANFIYDIGGEAFSPAFLIPDDVLNKEVKNKIRVSLDVFRIDEVPPNRLFLVFSAEKNDKTYHYVTSDIVMQTAEKNKWIKTEYIFTVPDELQKGTVVKIYIWNIDEKKVLIDNFKIEIAMQTDK